MQFNALPLAGAWEIILAPRGDERGHFARTYDRTLFDSHGLHRDWVQENESRTLRKHTIRGLHFQIPPFSETKLVRVATGAILDVLVDLRRSSSTYGRWTSVEVSAEKHNCVYIPRGFAHGFCTLTDDVVMLYKVDSVYSPEHERSLVWNDDVLAIEWPARDPLVSVKDRAAGRMAELESPFE
jgi:dTDP-4-dehydrorhamnose 3,5-epimerase